MFFGRTDLIPRGAPVLKQLFRYLFYVVLGTVTVSLGFAVYLALFQPVWYFPRPTGIYAIGVRDYHWVDKNRKELFAHDQNHPNRELIVKIWYPTDGKLPTQPTTLWAPDLVNYIKKNQKLMWLFLAARPFYCWSQPGAPFIAGQEQFPVIIFSHGRGPCNHDSNAAQCEELASQGYVVLAINHTYSSVLATFPDGRTIDGMKAIKQRSSSSSFTDIQNALNQELEIWIADVYFVIDQLEQLTQNTQSRFYQRLDMEHIGMFGHSVGGATTIQVCRRDARVKAGVNLDGGLLGTHVTEPFEKPLMFIFNRGMIDYHKKPMTQEFRKEWKITSKMEEQLFNEFAYLSALKLAQNMEHDTYIIALSNFGHLDFSYGAQLKQASFLLGLFGNMSSTSMIGSIDGTRAHKIVSAYLVNFFNKYLKGQQSALLDGGQKLFEEVEIILAK